MTAITAVGLNLLLGAIILLDLVFSQRHQQAVLDPAAMPASGSR